VPQVTPRGSIPTHVTIHNHAYQKLFPFVITRPNSLLSLLSPHINNQYVVKLPTSDSFPHPRLVVWYDVKLHILDPSQLDHLLLGTPLSLVPHRIHRRHGTIHNIRSRAPPRTCTHVTDHVEGLTARWHVPLLASPMTD
jgi:hypothetical protein